MLNNPPSGTDKVDGQLNIDRNNIFGILIFLLIH